MDKSRKYWNVTSILPYQRNFNFVDGPRSVGKTYSVIYFMIKEALLKQKQFIYLVRTIREKTDSALQKGIAKVCQNEFPDISFKCLGDTVSANEKILGYCIALSEAQKIKKNSYPGVYYIFFDEYMLEDATAGDYVKGWKEPDLLLSIYHTVDRQEDRVKCFLMGNNTNFYNPYHMHKAFRIPLTDKNPWLSENVLFYRIDKKSLAPGAELSRFERMIQGTKYGEYAQDGLYRDEGKDFIAKRPRTAQHYFSLRYSALTFGVWIDRKSGLYYIDDKFDPSNGLTFTLSLKDQTENTFLDRNNFFINLLRQAIMQGNIRFTSPEIRGLTDEMIRRLVQ